jgi:hypothetical protein
VFVRDLIEHVAATKVAAKKVAEDPPPNRCVRKEEPKEGVAGH